MKHLVGSQSFVMELDGLHWATQKNPVEAGLGRRQGVLSVEANPVAQTATVVFDPSKTTVQALAGRIADCGYDCRGESVPDHVRVSDDPGHEGYERGPVSGAEDRTGGPRSSPRSTGARSR